MRKTLLTLSVCAAALLALASPARAQALGAGISFLGDERGVGAMVDYSKPLSGKSGAGLVGEFGFNHKGFGGDFAGVTGGITTIMAQVGLRVTGDASEKATWHLQGLAGLMRSSFGVDAAGLNKAVCDAYDIDCSAGSSDIGGVVTVGGGLQYNLSRSGGLRAQLDIPIAVGADGGATTRFAVLYVIRR